MKSVTKAVFFSEELYALAQNAVPGCSVTEIRELTEGMFNRAYYICGSGALAGGAILKIGPREGAKLLTYEKDILRTEAAAYRLLEGKAVPDDEGFRIRTNLYRLYLSIIMYVETYRYEENYARYMKGQLKGRMETLLADLLTKSGGHGPSGGDT